MDNESKSTIRALVAYLSEPTGFETESTKNLRVLKERAALEPDVARAKAKTGAINEMSEYLAKNLANLKKALAKIGFESLVELAQMSEEARQKVAHDPDLLQAVEFIKQGIMAELTSDPLKWASAMTSVAGGNLGKFLLEQGIVLPTPKERGNRELPVPY